MGTLPPCHTDAGASALGPVLGSGRGRLVIRATAVHWHCLAFLLPAQAFQIHAMEDCSHTAIDLHALADTKRRKTIGAEQARHNLDAWCSHFTQTCMETNPGVPLSSQALSFFAVSLYAGQCLLAGAASPWTSSLVRDQAQ